MIPCVRAERKCLPVCAILAPTPRFIRAIPSTRREDNNVIGTDIASRVEEVDTLHNHLFASSIAAHPGELETLAAVSVAAHGGKAI